MIAVVGGLVLVMNVCFLKSLNEVSSMLVRESREQGKERFNTSVLMPCVVNRRRGTL